MATVNISVSKKENSVYPYRWVGSEPYCVTKDVVINEFDFMVIRFIWNYPSSGRDLDIQVRYENNNVLSVDGVCVGYGGSETVPSPSPAIKSDSYLWWGLDDTNSSGTSEGVEGVLVNLKKFKTDFPGSENLIKVGVYAVWSASVNSGDFQLEVKTYKGGSMSKSGTDIVNIGGTEVSSDVRDLNTLISNQARNPDSSFAIGVLEYNKTTDKAVLKIN